MKLFWYYAVHSLKNQVRKLFRTWVVVFLLICIGFGVVCGAVAASVDQALGEEETTEDVMTEDDLPPFDTKDVLPLTELVVAGGTVLMLMWNTLSAEKHGGQIFLMADVNLLFASPMKPQSVLLFRIATQLGTVLLASLYFSVQLPSLALDMGLGPVAAVSLVLLWFFLLIYAKLLNILLYTVTTTHSGAKRYLRPAVYGILLVVAGGFYLFWKSGEQPLFDALCAFFNAPWTRWIPVYGWLKGLLVYSALGAWWQAIACFAALLLGMGIFAWIIWHVKADFYEDALKKSGELAEQQPALQASGNAVTVTHSKERSQRLVRNTFTRGAGASVYFYKAMYNRFRFAHGRVFTKTSETYLVTAVSACAITYFWANTTSLIPAALILAVFCFFRSLGNPLNTDCDQIHFRMIPESAHRKVWYSLMGGTLNCFLDLVPAFLVATVWMRANLLEALTWLLLAVSIDLYSATVGLFLEVSIPIKIATVIKQLLQIMFIYFGLLPAAVLLIVGFMLHLVPLFLMLTVLLNLLISALFFGIAPLFIENGQR